MQTLDAGHKELYHGITEGLTNEFRDVSFFFKV